MSETTSPTDDELRTWAEAHLSVGCNQAAGVLRLLTERDEARRLARDRSDAVLKATRRLVELLGLATAIAEERDIARALALRLAERVAICSEILTTRAEKSRA